MAGYTENLGEFGIRELDLAIDLLQAAKKGYPSDFWTEGVKIGCNTYSGSVFLTNDNYDVCMDVRGELYTFYTSPYDGLEGFLWGLVGNYLDAPETWNEEDVIWLRELCSDPQIVEDNDIPEADVERVLANN